MSALPFKQVDVFTQKPFWGNPVAVVIGANALDTSAMQRIATWTNLTETTFVLPQSLSMADYRLRIFAPKQELPFAGHPTIGSAHAVLESGFASACDGELRQECLAGIIEISIEKTQTGERIFVHAPDARINDLNQDDAARLAAALGTPVILKSPLRVDVGVVWIVADLADCGTVADLQPKLQGIAELSAAHQAAGVTVFGEATDGLSSLQLRSFAPALGVVEDPVCGSGNAAVAAFLIHRGMMGKYGSHYVARQGMQVGRDGQVAISTDGRKIRVGGYAVTCVEGTLRID
ncbi:MAG: PhzF family phenazine biosynthesis protein [Candidatus Binatia bacterium]